MNLPTEIWCIINAFRKRAFRKRCAEFERMLMDCRGDTVMVHDEGCSQYSFYAAHIRFKIEVIKEYGTGLEFMSCFFYTLPYRDTIYGVITEKTYFKLDDGTVKRARVFY